MKDGIVIMYVKDDIIYPCVIGKDEMEIIEIFIAGMCNPLRIATNYPQGEAKNLVNKIKGRG